MTAKDALACRRALREIREIAAVALLDDAQISEQESLQTIAAIAGWAAEGTGSAPLDCANVIRRLDAAIGEADIESLDDRSAMDLFKTVIALLQSNVRHGAPAG
ncbi:hypothetical protein EGY25_03340 [Brevundimonas intermedia]|uniref:Uncharacterized protein n=1 Tax=Brevundimonas intermedia TaxID=74315 RepID=A0A4Y9S2F8_9CAUL|nr:hypothetical protein [Brevundimonas intermedia]TFW14246.1 hypothetical protein EGY25_03340 [Brevundimonas intermedia]